MTSTDDLTEAREAAQDAVAGALTDALGPDAVRAAPRVKHNHG